MRYDSLVNRVLDEGDEIWVEMESGEELETAYRDHRLAEGALELETMEGSYKFDRSSDAVDFGFSGDEEGFYDILSDFGVYGRDAVNKFLKTKESVEESFVDLESREPAKPRVD